MKDKLKSYHAGLWCADFVSTAFSQNGESPFGIQSRAFGIRDWGKANGRYVERGKGDPKKGDAIVFDGAGGQGHVGIVKEIKDGKVITLEGNSDDEVKEKSYALTDPKIQGYVRAFGDKP